MERLSRRIERGSVGLPVGVHVAAAPWREDIVLAVMGALEEAFRRKSDYPAEPPQPAIREATQSTA
jgi:fatty acid amide hydrolase